MIRRHPQAASEITAWYKIAHKAQWRNLQEVRRDFPKADQIGRVIVFNILHNQLRLITFEAFSAQRIYAKAILTHKEYDRKEWMKWA